MLVSSHNLGGTLIMNDHGGHGRTVTVCMTILSQHAVMNKMPFLWSLKSVQRTDGEDMMMVCPLGILWLQLMSQETGVALSELLLGSHWLSSESFVVSSEAPS